MREYDNLDKLIDILLCRGCSVKIKNDVAIIYNCDNKKVGKIKIKKIK